MTDHNPRSLDSSGLLDRLLYTQENLLYVTAIFTKSGENSERKALEGRKKVDRSRKALENC